MFICKQKINLIPQFVSQILHFKESYNLIGREHFVQQLANKNFAMENGVCNGKSRIKRQMAKRIV